MKLLIICLLSFLSIGSAGLSSAQDAAFLPVDHTYVYDIQKDESVRCTWTTTIIPQKPTIYYSISFTGGETRDYEAGDSLEQILDPTVSELPGARDIAVFLTGYNIDDPYSFDLAFTWDGLLSRNDKKYVLHTSVNVGEPQAATVVVLPPEGARMGTSYIIKGDSTEAFSKETREGRDALVWSTEDTGDDIQMEFIVNYYYSSPWITLRDYYQEALFAGGVIAVGGLLLGYRRRLPGLLSRVREMLKSEIR